MNEFENYFIDWVLEIYDELDDLEAFISENNPLMVYTTINEITDLLEDLRKEYKENLRKELRGELNEI